MPAFLLDFTLFSAQLIFFIPEDLEAIKEEYRASDKKDEYPKMMAAMRQRIYQRNKLHFVRGAQEAHNLKAKARWAFCSTRNQTAFYLFVFRSTQSQIAFYLYVYP